MVCYAIFWQKISVKKLVPRIKILLCQNPVFVALAFRQGGERQ